MAQKHPDELKAAVIADHQLGASYNQLARKHGVPKGTVQRWLTDHVVEPVPLPQKDELGQLVYDYLKAGLLALTAQAKQAATPDLIREQGQSLYLLHGVLADKIVLVLRALERVEDDEPGTDALRRSDTEGAIVAG